MPAGWAGRRVEASINLAFTNSPGFQAEGLLWGERPEGSGTWVPLRGLHPFNHEVAVADPAVGGESVSYLVEAAANPNLTAHRPDSSSDVLTAGTAPIYSLTRAELILVEVDVVELREDVRALHELMGLLPLDQPRRHEILRALERMLDVLVLDDIAGTAAAAREELAEVLSRPAVPSAHRLSAIGHAHIDSAWLWPIRETKRKCARTFSNVLALMDDYPELKFGCSQAAQYEWMLDGYPSVFEGIAERVADGRWIPTGGMWVEPDTNLAGGEALVRQITHGQRFFQEHFGRRSTEVWIPDVFGYPASLPQIMRLGGIERFLTQKMSWNKTNRFPHHTFWWEGIDGSTVFTHFPPIDSYNALFRPSQLDHAVRNFTEKGRATRSLMPFGFGNGGGGPNRQMMREYQRVRDLEGLPRVEIESAEEFFDAAMAEYPDAPRWVGRALLRDAPGHLHQPGPHQARQPAVRAAPPGGRAVVRGGLRTTPGTRRPSSTGSGRPFCCTSSTTSCRAPRSGGCTARPRRPTPSSSCSSRRSSPARSNDSPRRSTVPWWPTRPPRPRRGRRAADRPTRTAALGDTGTGAGRRDVGRGAGAGAGARRRRSSIAVEATDEVTFDDATAACWPTVRWR